jgi:hypothetical protein
MRGINFLTGGEPVSVSKRTLLLGERERDRQRVARLTF